MNTKVTVMLNDFNKIRKFTTEVSGFESDIDLVRGRYIIDAKSIVGIFTLDLSEPVDVVLWSENEEEINRFKKIMKEFK